jgi:O-antigen/teichoic acid export membrane protein
MLIRHTLLYLPAQIIGPVSQFIAIVVFTHWMAPEPYGILTYIMASQDFVFFLCLSWWSQYTIRYFSNRATGADARYRESEFTIMLCTMAAQIVASLLVILLISTRISVALAGATILYMVTRCFILHLGERARAQGRVTDYTVAAAAGPLAGFALAFAAVAFVGSTPVAALSGYGVAQTLSLGWLAMRQDIVVSLRMPDRALLRQALTFGLPLIAAGLAAWFSMNAIRILVDHQIGAKAMGLIAVGWGLGHRLTTTASMFVTVAAFPLAVESFRLGSKERAYQQITTNGLLMFGIVLPATVGLYLLQEPLTALFVAAPFRATTLAVLPAALAAGLFRNIRTHVAEQVFILIERTPMVCLMTVVETILVVGGCVAGIKTDGAAGAAIGSAIGYGAAMIVDFAVARSRAGLRVPLLHTGLIIAATLVMAMVIALLPGSEALPGGAITRLVLVVAVGAAAYLAAILAFFPSIARGIWQLRTLRARRSERGAA